MKLSQSIYLFTTAIVISGCSGSRGVGTSPVQAQLADGRVLPVPGEGCNQTVLTPERNQTILSESRIGGQAVHATAPPAMVYRMSGDYAGNVAVTLNPQGGLLSYPAPSDISPERSAPVELAGGWWLDRRGVGDNSVFTRYTLKEYAAMKTAPTPEELLAAVIPGARVVQVMRLPMTLATAEADTAAVNLYISRHAPGIVFKK